MDKLILSIDCGTQSLRTLLFNPKGELLDGIQIQYEPYISPKPGWAEQDPEIFWKSVCDTCNSLKAKDPDLFGKIAGIGVTTQRASMVNVDKDGITLRPVIIWLDQRKAREVYSPGIIMKPILKAAGIYRTMMKVQTDGKCNWIRQYEPEIWANTHKYLQVSGFLNFRLTGEFSDSSGSQIGHIPWNYKKMRWAKKWEPASRLFPVEGEKLPKTVQPGELIGTVTAKASQETGLAEGLPVIACGSDKGCETVGMGVVDDTTASLSFGTTATVQTTTRKYFEPLRFKPPYPASIPGHYNPEIEIFRGFWLVTWFKNEFAHKEVLEAEERGVLAEEVMNDLLVQSPAGCMGLMVQPYWGPGLNTPSAKGCMIGFGGVHRKAHVYRAVIEGLGYGLLDGLQSMQKAGKFKVEKVAVSGGASQSDEICRISADIFNLPLYRGGTHETSGLGAAIVTSVGLGIHPSFETAMHEMVSYKKVFEPDPKNVEIYANLYERVYKKIYGSLRPLYREIREITGYPE